MLEFKTITKQTASRLRKYYERCDYGLCEYSVGTKMMWSRALNTVWAEAAGCLIMRCGKEGHWKFDYPVPGPEGDEEAALDVIEACCMEAGVSPVFSIVPECKLITWKSPSRC